MVAKTKEGYSASFLLKEVFGNPPKNSDRIVAILPSDDTKQSWFPWLTSTFDFNHLENKQAN